jgi:long-chain fatty acid transport protein
MSFFGLDMADAGGLQTNLRVGGWWRPDPRVSLGLVYQTETDSEFEDGDMTVNFTAHPFLQRKVGYTAEMDGFTFAAQAGAGVALRPGDDWVLALDVKRYFWDDAIDTITVTARDPDVAGAPAEIVVPFVFDWKDQWVIAVGADYRLSDRTTLRAGYNYGENPVPDETLNPLFPATTEHHATVGAGWLVGGRLIEVAVERAFGNDRTNPNPNPMVNPFGPGARVAHDQWTVSFGVSWAWARGNG